MTNCEECGYYQSESPGVIKHAPTCSRIGFEDAKHYALYFMKVSESYSKRIGHFMRQAQWWEGKFRQVVRENNKLRKKIK